MTIGHPLLQNVVSLVGQWWHGTQIAIQEFQSSVTETLPRFPQAIGQGQLALTRLLQQSESSRGAYKDIAAGVRELESWRKNPTWVDEKAIIEVTVPAGALCQLNSTFTVGLPPLAVFDILSDPENKRVFKDIQEVRYRKVLEDYGERQVIELEQAAIWRFLWLTGTLSVFVKVDQDRKKLSLNYELGKEGFMKRFEGSWNIEPLYIDAHNGTGKGRVASLVQLYQVVEPTLMPPPPITWYVRGITSRTMEKLLGDLQAEGKRLREGRNDSQVTATEVANVESKTGQKPLLNRLGRLPARASGWSRKNSKKKWRRINL